MDQPDACDASCPVARTAGIISGKWTTLIIRDLLGGSRRYSELQRSLGNVSPRMLAMRLAELEEAGLITKTITPSVPPRTDYALTERGLRLRPVIAAMAEFGASL